MSVLDTLAKGERIEIRCPYCNAGLEYKGHVIPPDACCPPRALEQITWITAYLSRPEVSPRRDSEVMNLRDTSASLYRRLVAWEAEKPGTLRFALAMIQERFGEGSPTLVKARQMAKNISRRASKEGGGEE